MTIPVLDSTKDILESLPARETVFAANTIEDLHWLTQDIHARNRKWWVNLETGAPLDRNVGEMIALCHSELSEALEGHRKRIMDDKLPHRPNFRVELIDAVIRLLDLLGSVDNSQHPAGTIFEEKRAFNKTRPDHLPENRLKEGGKVF